MGLALYRNPVVLFSLLKQGLGSDGQFDVGSGYIRNEAGIIFIHGLVLNMREMGMHKKTLMQIARRLFLLAAAAGTLLVLGTSQVMAGGGAPLTCSISPTNGSATVNVPFTFTANTSGGKGSKSYAWTFSGPVSPTSSTNQSQDVTYSATGGPFSVSVHVTDKSGECTAATNVTIGGGMQHAPVANNDADITTQDTSVTTNVVGNDSDQDGDLDPTTVSIVTNGSNGTAVSNGNGTVTYTPNTGFFGTDNYTYNVKDLIGNTSNTATVTITVQEVGGGGGVTSRGDTYATPVGTTLTVAASRISGVLYNDFGGAGPLTAQLVSSPANGTVDLHEDGGFVYTPNASLSDNDNDSFTYQAYDGVDTSAVTTVNINIVSKQTDFKIMMNYELGMHCTGFEFAYCCVLPPYNSILAQVVKPQPAGDPVTGGDFPRLLEGDPNNTDGLGRPTVVRDAQLDGSGKFKKYFLEYYHDAQPRHEGQGKTQTTTLISNAEGNSLFYTSTIYDSAAPDAGNKLQYGSYEGAYGVVQGDGDFNDPTDNYANGWLNHFYIYVDQGNPTTIGPNLEGHGATGLEGDKIRLGVAGQVAYPANVGAALQPLGPTGSAAPFDNVLTYSGDTGTVVYTQMKVLEDLPIMLTSPKIWEALGLPLTPFEDSIDFFSPMGPGSLDEDSIRPYVEMKAALHVAICDDNGQGCTEGAAVIGSNGKPVIGFGTAPIDIPNCERCHSVPATTPMGCVEGNPGCVANTNSPSYIRSDFAFPHGGTYAGQSLEAVTSAEKSFWDAYYTIVEGVDSDWYSRLKGAAINMLSLHDFDNGTSFTSNWPNGAISLPPAKAAFEQNTRLGKESVICQKCHADNVIAVVKSATCAAGNPKCTAGTLIEPITEAIHRRHREVSENGSIDFADAAGRSGGCQGCHPAHRSDGVMDGYPITKGGDNFQANSDNRLASGGCFVGRDVHSNPMKDVDGAETPAHLNAVGSWLSSNVFYNQDGVAGVSGSPTRGLWCTNCHTQLGQEMWRTEDCNDLIHGDCLVNPRGAASLSTLATMLGTNQSQLDFLAGSDKSTNAVDDTHRIWDPAIPDANVATIEVDGSGDPVVTFDGDGDPNVNILSFCTTTDCVNRINANKTNQSQWRYPANPFKDASLHQDTSRRRCRSARPTTRATTGCHRVSRIVRIAMRRPTWSRAATSTPTRPSITRRRRA